MEEKNKKKNINIYEVAGKVGKEVRKYSGWAVIAVGTFFIKKGPDLIKKVKK